MTTGRRTLLGSGLSIVGAVVVPFSAALPWVESGQAKKSIFQLARTAREFGLAEAADQLGVANRWVVEALLGALFLAPLLAGFLVLLMLLRARKTAACVTGFVALIGVAGGGLGLAALPGGLAGPLVALGGGLFALVGGFLQLASRKGPAVPG